MNDFKDLLVQLNNDFPSIKFEDGERFAWSPSKKSVQYNNSNKNTDTWSLLHELSHASLNHSSYTRDYELIKLEVEAWEEAQSLANKYGISIDKEYVQDCIDTYRDWLHSRSRCPLCQNTGVQTGPRSSYRCVNCSKVWRVSNSRLCRAYRAVKQP